MIFLFTFLNHLVLTTLFSFSPVKNIHQTSYPVHSIPLYYSSHPFDDRSRPQHEYYWDETATSGFRHSGPNSNVRSRATLGGFRPVFSTGPRQASSPSCHSPSSSGVRLPRMAHFKQQDGNTALFIYAYGDHIHYAVGRRQRRYRYQLVPPPAHAGSRSMCCCQEYIS